MQPRMPPDVAQVISGLEIVPTSDVAGIPVVDVRRLLERRPQVCLVDGLAYDNPPGTRHPKRYQDVEELLEAGISVLTSINLEYIAEQQEFVRQVVGRTAARHGPAGIHRTAPTKWWWWTRRRRLTRVAPGRLRNPAPARAAADRRSGRPSARRLPATPRAAVVVGHAGADPRLHDAARQRRRGCSPAGAATRTGSTASCSPSTSTQERPDGRRPHGPRAERDARARATGARRHPRGTGPGGDHPRLRPAPRHHAAVRRPQPAPHLDARFRGTPLDRLIREAEGMDVRVFPQ